MEASVETESNLADPEPVILFLEKNDENGRG